MKKSLFLLVLLFAVNILNAQKINYDDHFTGDRLRIDFVFAGNATSQNVYLDGLKMESAWSGSRTSLIAPFDYGEYRLEVKAKDGKLIYSTGFNNLFQEWRTTAEAAVTPRAFSGSCRIPFPKESVAVIVSEREKQTGKFRQIASFQIDPQDKLINRERENNYKTISLHHSGEPANKVDLLFIAEGYTAEQMDKFRADAQRFVKYLFETEPYKSRKSDFNIWAVESVSSEAGPDIPQQGIWKNTAAASNFYTFRLDRYLTAPDHKKVSSIASESPCDAMYVIVNTDKYGGGGIYNYYGLSMADHPTASQVFVHEFGHSFAGLGDEYYASEVAYEDFYNLKTEPWEPNLTTLVDFDRKWKKMIDKNTPVPTPNDGKFNGVTGVFEGGGYMTKGIYRPALDCRMKSNTAPGFCEVCVKAIGDMIDYYTK